MDYHLLALVEVRLVLDEVWLEGRPRLVSNILPCPKILLMLADLGNESVCNADRLGLGDRLSRCCCEISALIKLLDEAWYQLFRVIWRAEALIVSRHFCCFDMTAGCIQVHEVLEGCLYQLSCLSVLQGQQVGVCEYSHELVLGGNVHHPAHTIHVLRLPVFL